MLNPFRRTTLSARQERAVQRTLQQLRQQRRQRFRILACIDGSEESFITVRFAARLAPTNDCDIIVLNVRPVDQGLWSGGLQVRLARQNMLDAGFDLPGVRELKQALEILKHEGLDVSAWQRETAHVAGQDPIIIGFITAISSAFGYLTPAAQPAFTIIYASGYLKGSDFLKIGHRMMIVSLLLLFAVAQLYWPFVHY